MVHAVGSAASDEARTVEMAHGVTTVPGHAHHSCPGGPAVVDVGVRQCSPLFLGLLVPKKAAPQEPP